MSWSATEVAALAAKAARGAGAPPEQALRFGQVTAEHLMARRDPAVLAAALADLPSGPILTYPRIIDAALSAGGKVPGSLAEVCHEDLFASYVEALPFEARFQVFKGEIQNLTIVLDTPRTRGPPKRIKGCDALINKMTEMAEKTLVPESENSRLSGAGAGLSDND